MAARALECESDAMDAVTCRFERNAVVGGVDLLVIGDVELAVGAS
ncbi:hypothetical protein [Natronorubrum sp. DTA7]